MIVLMFGPPGSGKGTQAAIIAPELQIPHISTGEMLRAEIAHGSALGREVAPIIDKGELVSDDLMVRVMESRLGEPDAHAGAVLDGFPRTVPQAEALDVLLRRGGRRVDVVISIEVSPEVLVGRILHRGQTDGRADDNAEVFAARMDAYRADSEPVLGYYRGVGTRVEPVAGVGSVEEVGARILEVLSEKDDPGAGHGGGLAGARFSPGNAAPAPALAEDAS